MKKLISRRNFLKVCALAGSAAALSACGGGKSTGNNSAAAAVDTTGAVEFPLPEKVTFTGMTSFPVGSEPEPNKPHHLQASGRADQCAQRLDRHPVRPVER